MRKRFAGILLVVVMLCNDYVLLSVPNNLPVSKATNTQSKELGIFKKVFGRIKSKTRKLYDCVLGNDETCTPDEIMLVRVVIFVAILAGYGKVNALREARRFAEGQRRIQTRIDNGVTPEELAELRTQYNEQYAQEFFDGDAPGYLDMLRQSMIASFENSNNSSDEIVEVDDTFEPKVKLDRQSFFENHQNPNIPDSCIVCLEDAPADLGNVPCTNTHTEGLCIACLARLMHDGSPCPLCRGNLFG